MPGITARTPGNGVSSLAYTIPLEGLDVESVYVEIDASGAAGAVTAELVVTDQSGAVIARRPQPSTIPSGGPGTATWGLRLADDSGGSTTPASLLGPLWGVPAWQSGVYYQPQWQAYSGQAVSGVGGRLVVYPIWIPNSVTVASLSTYVSAVAGGQTLRLGLWTDTGHGYPNVNIIDTGAFVPGAPGPYDVAVGLAVSPGLYWLGIVLVGNTIGVQGFGGGPGVGTLEQTVVATGSLADYVSGQGATNYQLSPITGALPSPFPAGAHPHTLGAGPGCYVKTA